MWLELFTINVHYIWNLTKNTGKNTQIQPTKTCPLIVLNILILSHQFYLYNTKYMETTLPNRNMASSLILPPRSSEAHLF